MSNIQAQSREKCEKFILCAIENKHRIDQSTFSRIYDYILSNSFDYSKDLVYLKSQIHSNPSIKNLRNFFQNESEELIDVYSQINLFIFLVVSSPNLIVSSDFIEEVYSILFAEETLQWRTTEYIKDFGGEVSTHTALLHEKFNEFNQYFIEVSNKQINRSNTQARILSKVYASIIRIHPFADGNGRLARFICLFFTIRWRNNIVIIPKVRNDEEWRVALEGGVKGDESLLVQWFTDRLEG